MCGDRKYSGLHLTNLRVERRDLCFYELEQIIEYFLGNTILLPHVHTG